MSSFRAGAQTVDGGRCFAPSWHSTHYWGQKTQNLATTLTKRKGQRSFDLHHRPLVGDTASLALGPGSLVQEDATIADIYRRRANSTAVASLDALSSMSSSMSSAA